MESSTFPIKVLSDSTWVIATAKPVSRPRRKTRRTASELRFNVRTLCTTFAPDRRLPAGSKSSTFSSPKVRDRLASFDFLVLNVCYLTVLARSAPKGDEDPADSRIFWCGGLCDLHFADTEYLHLAWSATLIQPASLRENLVDTRSFDPRVPRSLISSGLFLKGRRNESL